MKLGPPFMLLLLQRVSVGLMDADVYGPSIPRLMNLSQQPEISKRQLVLSK